MIRAGILAAVMASPAVAGGNCGPHADVVSGLLKGYGEVSIASGAAGSNSTMELFLNPATGTWTVIATLPNGSACLLASGNNWKMSAVEAPGVGG